MKKALWLALLPLLLFACVPSQALPQSGVVVATKTNANAVGVVIRNNGISVDTADVMVRNFYPGARAEQIFSIHNATDKAVMPEMYYVPDGDSSNYSHPNANGAIKAPDFVRDWIKFPELTEITPGEISEFTMALEMPKDAKKSFEKAGFLIGIDAKTKNMLQPAVQVWWVITMR